MDLPPLFVIHEVLPPEMLGAIFEEHAKLEWKAPTIDGRVCRFWRQIVLNTPRAWSHLEIYGENLPGIWSLTSWLGRSGTAPLRIGVTKNFTPDQHINERTFYDLLGDHYNRIAVLRMYRGEPSFFEGRDFPCLQHLDVENWFPIYLPSMVSWGSMPELRSLHLGGTVVSGVPLSIMASFTALSLYNGSSICLPQRFNSLTRLMLDDVGLADSISGLVVFPSLMYLSLYKVHGLKPHIHAPRLITYHESGHTIPESFPAPLPTLIEYGVYGIHADDSHLAEWHLLFPNILRLSLRAEQHVLVSSLESLVNQPHSIPALHMISLGDSYDTKITEDSQRKMESLVRARGKLCDIDIVVHFETGPSFQIPLFFGAVSASQVALYIADTNTRNRIFRTEDHLAPSPHSRRIVR